MTLNEKIKEDIKTAMKAKDAKTLEVLRMLASSVKNKAIDLKEELQDADVIAVIKSDVKKLEDAIVQFVQGAREDLAEKTKEEITILKKYLPEEMSDEVLKEKVEAILKKVGIEDPSKIGQAIGAVMAELKGMVDGGRVKKMVEGFFKKAE